MPSTWPQNKYLTDSKKPPGLWYITKWSAHTQISSTKHTVSHTSQCREKTNNRQNSTKCTFSFVNQSHSHTQTQQKSLIIWTWAVCIQTLKRPQTPGQARVPGEFTQQDQPVEQIHLWRCKLPLVEFMYLTYVPGENYCNWFRSLLLGSHDMFRELVNSPCWFYGAQVAEIITVQPHLGYDSKNGRKKNL